MTAQPREAAQSAGLPKVSGRRRFAMSSPQKGVLALDRIGRFVAALLLLVALIEPPHAAADDQPDPYTVTVKVDATADNAVEARRIARLDGQRQALAKAVAQLAGSPDVKLPKLSD